MKIYSKQKNTKIFSMILLSIIFGMLIGCSVLFNPGFKIALDPATYNFGTVQVNQNVQAEFTIRNTIENSKPLTINNISIKGTNAGEFKLIGGSITPIVVLANKKHSIILEFNPTSAGPKDAILHLEHDGPGLITEATLTGIAIVEPEITVTPTNYSYDEVGINASVSADFTIHNTGNSELIISTIEITNDANNNFQISAGAPAGLDIKLNSAEIHTFTITFTPDSLTTFEANFSIRHNADVTPYIGTISGNGSNQVSISPSSHDFGDQEINVASKQFSFTISNPTAVDVSISEIAFSGADATDFTSDPSGIAIWNVPANGGTFVVQTYFNPSDMGASSASLDIVHDNGSLYANVTGNGVSKPNFSITPDTHDFGTLEVLKTKTTNFTVSNNGSGILDLQSVTIVNDAEGNFAIVSGGSGTSIPASGSSQLQVSFTPKTEGNKSAVIRIEYNASTSPAFVNLSGLGATVTITPSAYNFGDVEMGISPAPTFTFSVVNATSAPVNLTNVGLIGPNAAQFTVNPVGNMSAIVQGNGGMFDLIVTCTPTTSGSLSASLQVTFTGGILNADISATGVSMPEFNIVPTSHNFGTIRLGSSSRHDFVVTNTGNGDLVMSTIRLTNNAGGNFSIFSGGTSSGSVTVRPQQSHTITIVFAPQEFGVLSANLNIQHNGANSPFNGRLDGNGDGPALTLIPDVAAYNFGAQFVGETTEKVFFIKNTGDEDLIITAGSLSNGTNFSVTGPSTPITIIPGRIIHFTITFSPTTTGNLQDQLSITHNSANSPRNISLTGTGQQYTYYLNEDFEGSAAPADWYITRYGDWQWGRPSTSFGPRYAFSGSRCYGTRIYGNYRNNQNCVLVTPTINLQSATNPVLKFAQWVSAEAIYDGGWLEISTDDGGSWTQINNPVPDYNDTINVSGTPTDVYSDDQSALGWHYVTVDLTAYAGQSTVRILWHFYSDGGTTAPGWYIDDAKVFEDIGPEAATCVSPIDNDISVPVTANSFMLKWECPNATSYDVYLGTTYPPTSLIASRISAKQFSATVSGYNSYYWKVVSHNSHGSTTSAIWYFETINHVPHVLLNEIDASNPTDWMEFYNTESIPIMIGKWKYTIWWSFTNGGTYEFPEYTFIYPQDFIILYDSTASSSLPYRMSFNIPWTSIANYGEIIWQYPDVYDSIGVDYMRFNVVSPNHKPADLNWSGILSSTNTGWLNWYRNSGTDNDSTSDWYSRRNSADRGSKNPGQ